MTKIISFYGGPGAGKSSAAAGLFHQLKTKNVNSELVSEYAKMWAWEGRHIRTYDQIYFLGKQIRREALLLDKVDVIVTDSPVWLVSYYAKKYGTKLISDGVNELVSAYYKQAETDGYEHIHLWINRKEVYNPKGRYETEEQAKEIDKELRALLDENKVVYSETNGDKESLTALAEKISNGVE